MATLRFYSLSLLPNNTIEQYDIWFLLLKGVLHKHSIKIIIILIIIVLALSPLLIIVGFSNAAERDIGSCIILIIIIYIGHKLWYVYLIYYMLYGLTVVCPNCPICVAIIQYLYEFMRV